MDAHDVVLIGGLVDRCPALLPVLQAHLDAYEEFLPHLFMGDVTRWASERYLRSSSDPELKSAQQVGTPAKISPGAIYEALMLGREIEGLMPLPIDDFLAAKCHSGRPQSSVPRLSGCHCSAGCHRKDNGHDGGDDDPDQGD